MSKQRIKDLYDIIWDNFEGVPQRQIMVTTANILTGEKLTIKSVAEVVSQLIFYFKMEEDLPIDTLIEKALNQHGNIDDDIFGRKMAEFFMDPLKIEAKQHTFLCLIKFLLLKIEELDG